MRENFVNQLDSSGFRLLEFDRDLLESTTSPIRAIHLATTLELGLTSSCLLINEYEIFNFHGAKVIIKSRTVPSIKFHITIVPQVDKTKILPY